MEALTPEELARVVASNPALFAQRGSGRADLPVDQIIQSVTDLTFEDLRRAEQAVESGTTLPPAVGSSGPNGQGLKTIRYSHHRLAQLLAGGMDNSRAAILCNYQPSYVTSLQRDPAFQELLAHYADQMSDAFTDFVSAATQLNLDLLDHLRDLLDTKPDKMTPYVTIEAIKALADRTGNGPVVRQQNINVNLTMGDRVKAARERVQAAERERAITVQPTILAQT